MFFKWSFFLEFIPLKVTYIILSTLIQYQLYVSHDTLFFPKGTALWGKYEPVPMCKATEVWTHRGRSYCLCLTWISWKYYWFMSKLTRKKDDCRRNLHFLVSHDSSSQFTFVMSHHLYCRERCLRLRRTWIQNSSSIQFIPLDVPPVIRWDLIISPDSVDRPSVW